MKTISLKLPNDIADKLEKETYMRGSTKSYMVREALAEYFSKSHQTKPGSFLDLAKDLCGSVVGPVDLSTNKKHMEKYGKSKDNN